MFNLMPGKMVSNLRFTKNDRFSSAEWEEYWGWLWFRWRPTRQSRRSRGSVIWTRPDGSWGDFESRWLENEFRARKLWKDEQ